MWPLWSRLQRNLHGKLASVVSRMFWFVLTTAADSALASLKLAARMRFVRFADDTLLVDIGQERNLVRYTFDNRFADRVVGAFSLHQAAGSDQAIVDALTYFGFQASLRLNRDWGTPSWNSPIRSWNSPGNAWNAYGPPDGNVGFWNRFWVVIQVPAIRAWNNPAKVWNGGGGATWNDAGLTQAQLDIIVRETRYWKGAWCLFAGIVLQDPSGNEDIIDVNV